MSSIRVVVTQAEKLSYQAQAEREGKSLEQWLRDAADEKLARARPRRFTIEELHEFEAACDARRRPGAREPDWPEVKQMLAESRFRPWEIE